MGILRKGHGTTVRFGSFPAITFMAAKEVTPPEYNGGDGISTSTLENETYHTKAAQTLIEVGNATFQCVYDATRLDEILSMINVEQDIIFTYSDGSTETIPGWVQAFARQTINEDSQPVADVTIAASMENSSGVEQDITFA